MKDSFCQSMAWLHTWVGRLLGWVLYFMFITGTAEYLDTETDRWMKPELSVSQWLVPTENVAQASLSYLSDHALLADRWFIGFPHNRNTPHPSVFWNGAKGEGNRYIFDKVFEVPALLEGSGRAPPRVGLADGQPVAVPGRGGPACLRWRRCW